MPYICVDYSLKQQLVSLSTTAHLVLYLYTDNRARTAFLPNQTYVNLMMMIKNIYFCIAKSKVDQLNGQFYIILLGTDRLEGLFALVRCAVGSDSNVDILQLSSRATGLTQIAAILAIHPEWDHGGPRCLNLPAITAADNLHTKVMYC